MAFSFFLAHAWADLQLRHFHVPLLWKKGRLGSVMAPINGCKESTRSRKCASVVYLQHPNRACLRRSNQMRAVVQRVSRAQVSVNGEIMGRIGLGLLVLLGVGHSDTEADATYLAEKISGLRIFEDDQGKMNRSIQQAGGSVLAVSQFTLYGDVRRGKRPSFDAAAPPEKARTLYEFLVERIRQGGLICETGRFQEMMTLELVNEGPVTILLDSAKGF